MELVQKLLCFYVLCRFADVLHTHGRKVSYIGKRSDIALNLCNQQWHNTDKEVRHEECTLPPDLHLIKQFRFTWSPTKNINWSDRKSSWRVCWFTCLLAVGMLAPTQLLTSSAVWFDDLNTLVAFGLIWLNSKVTEEKWMMNYSSVCCIFNSD